MGARMRGTAVNSDTKLRAPARFSGTRPAYMAKMQGVRSASPKPTAAKENTLNI